MNALTFPLDNRLTVVLFAGMGGACDGLEWAGFPVHIAINHDPVAVAVHESRHPHTRHLRCDVFEADPRAVCHGRPVRVLHASPDCTHFSVAKGGKPVSPRRRSLAWIVCRWAGTVRPETITLENVSEIQTWGPLVAKRDPATGRVVKLDGSIACKGEVVPVREQWLVPDPRYKGRIWQSWLNHLRGLGYSFEGRVMVCADYGVPTIRKRFFGVAKADGGPIVWPERTHAPRDKARKLGLKPWVGAYTCLDFSLPMKSIFGRAKSLAEATLRRTARGVVRYVLGTKKPFLVPITHTKGGNNARSTSDPLGTITTAKGGEQMVMVPALARYRGDSAGSDMRDPIPALTANSFRKRPGGALPVGVIAATVVGLAHGNSRSGGLGRERSVLDPMTTIHAGGGNAALVAAFLAQHNDGPRAGVSARDIAEPLSSITTTGSQQGFVAAALGCMRGSNLAGRDVRDPVPAIMAGGNHANLILGFLQHYYSTGGQHGDLADPLGAITAKARHGLVTVPVDGTDCVMTDILIRMLEPEEGAACHGFLPGSLPDEITIDGKRRRLTKTEKYHLVGNSVPPRMVKLLAEHNVRRELAMEAAE